MKKKSGFTLIELLVVLVLLSILVFLTLGVGESVTANSRITGLINNFLADFSAAKLLAAAENRYVAITFSPDGRSYTVQKLADNDFVDGVLYNDWTTVKTVTPFSDRSFFNVADVSNFAVNSTGVVRMLEVDGSVDISNNPDNVSLVFFIRKGRGVSTDPIAYQRTIQIFPYGGLKVEKH